MEVEISCCLCSNSYKTEIELPKGWDIRCSLLYAEDGFCPKHILVSEFADHQCPGCVGGWGDCNLWRDFAYTGRRNMSEEDFNIIKTGMCPKRTNGSFSFSRKNGIKHEDISEKATAASGEALANAIREYLEKYPDK